ncbi:hypothetical protein [Paludibaculum fermentans]|uniref:hypothetical protein n=1 Tax=Paludibaculum fermentans TaxID=1473598 RepID=UPI003EB99690
MLDLRKPAGYFFGLLGLLLTGTGLMANFNAPLLDSNLNLHFGVFSIAFGGIFLWLARRA